MQQFFIFAQLLFMKSQLFDVDSIIFVGISFSLILCLLKRLLFNIDFDDLLCWMIYFSSWFGLKFTFLTNECFLFLNLDLKTRLMDITFTLGTLEHLFFGSLQLAKQTSKRFLRFLYFLTLLLSLNFLLNLFDLLLHFLCLSYFRWVFIFIHLFLFNQRFLVLSFIILWNRRFTLLIMKLYLCLHYFSLIFLFTFKTILLQYILTRFNWYLLYLILQLLS